MASSGDAAEEARVRQMAGDLRFRLRDATDAAHRRLDAGFAGHDLAQRADYTAFLGAMRAAFGPLEAWLDRTDARFLPPDWSARRRADALRRDLSGLGAVAFEAAGDALPATLAPGEAPGLLYVLEGSRLGGQVLLRRVLASPDPLVRENARFLRHGEGLRLWQSFTAWLGTRPAPEHDAAIAGALRAFAMFEAVQAGIAASASARPRISAV